MFFGPTAAHRGRAGARRPGRGRRRPRSSRRSSGSPGTSTRSRPRASTPAASRAYAELAERARRLGDAASVERAERGAAGALERFDAVLAPERYEEGDAGAARARLPGGRECRAERDSAGRSDPGAWKVAAAALGRARDAARARLRPVAPGRGAAGRRRGPLGGRRSCSRARPPTTRETGATALLAEIEALARRARLELDGAEPAGDERRRRGAGRAARAHRARARGPRAGRRGVHQPRDRRALFIAEKTASVHVSRILGKLGVRGRVEAATKAQRLGLCQRSQVLTIAFANPIP